jgi:bifunctional UDP-N-acetylglucosamine pyrophosphorylase/glucosamine-1-phosphate N-acetyltransferase
MLAYILETASAAEPAETVVVVGSEAHGVTEICRGRPSTSTVVQEAQLGTGHAAMQARQALEHFDGDVLILSGDTPLIRASTALELLARHRSEGAILTCLTMTPPDPSGYGRIIRNDSGQIARIVEERDAEEAELALGEVNGGIYCADPSVLFPALEELKPDNVQGEYYLTDVVGMVAEKGLKVAGYAVPDWQEALGINSRAELAALTRLMRQRINARHMEAGVTFIDPEAAYIDHQVTIGPDTVIHPQVHLWGDTAVGRGCELWPGAHVINSRLGDEVLVKDSSLVTESDVGSRVQIGPCAHLRPEVVLGDGVKIGNFVEIKKSELGPGSKANHLTYIGDTSVGAGANIGAGTITCNYDGIQKHRTIIEDEVFIGSDVQLVAPVRVGRGAIVGAGTTVTKDVPAYSLALSRPEQINKEDWAHQYWAKRDEIKAEKKGQEED